MHSGGEQSAQTQRPHARQWWRRLKTAVKADRQSSQCVTAASGVHLAGPAGPRGADAYGVRCAGGGSTARSSAAASPAWRRRYLFCGVFRGEKIKGEK